MDPAGPCFQGLCDSLILDRTDAQIVEIYHTNTVLFGTQCLYGCLDYIVNGGVNQPGCIPYDYLCAHAYAFHVFCGIIKSPESVHRCVDSRGHTLGVFGQTDAVTCSETAIAISMAANDPYCPV